MNRLFPVTGDEDQLVVAVEVGVRLVDEAVAHESDRARPRRRDDRQLERVTVEYIVGTTVWVTIQTY